MTAARRNAAPSSIRRITAAVFAGALTLAACGVPTNERVESIPAEQLPQGLRPTDSTIDARPVDQEPIDVWLVRDDRLVASRHRVDPPVDPQRALDELLRGPTPAEQNRSLRSAIPDASAVLSAVAERGVVSVELAPAFADIPASDQLLAVGQIVLTLTDLRGVGRVRFVVDEAQIAVPLPSGESSDESVSRDDYLSLAEPTPSTSSS
jgi:spore germination protein GerM